jgi:hypothetical protein
LFECRSIPLNFTWASFGLKRDRTLTSGLLTYAG